MADLLEAPPRPTGSPAEARERRRAEARAAIGVDGAVDVGPTGAPSHPFLVRQAGLLALTAGAPAAVVALVGLPIAAGTGQSGTLVSSMLATFGIAAGIGASLAPAAAAHFSTAGARHARTAMVGALLVIAGVLLVGTLTPVGGMAVAGIGTGMTVVGRTTVLARGRRQGGGVLDLAIGHVGTHLGTVLAAVTIGAIAWATDATIPGILAGLAIVLFAAAVGAADITTETVPDGDLARLHELVGGTDLDVDDAASEAYRRVWDNETLRGLLPAYAAIGIAQSALLIQLVRFLTLELDLGLWGRGIVFAAIAVASAAAVAIVAGQDQNRYRDDPARVAVAVVGALGAAGTLLVLGANWPWYSAVLLLLAGFALVAVAHAQLDTIVVAALRPALRGHGIALASTVLLFGGIGIGTLLLDAVGRRGNAAAVIATAGVALWGAALASRRASETTDVDLDAAVDDAVEAAEARIKRASGVTMPLLACSNINFAYGSVQVLFDVDFSIDEGEMVGLLGTNGAGKSTLLRVISGLGTPMSGTVRQFGEDITYLDPAARVARGITQIPGGKAVFGSMSVTDNLRVFGHALGRDRKAVDAGIEQSFEAFPRLHERRNVASRVLSGGERQMLALSKALILEPKLLLIDELSLGLAPVIVGQLIDMLRVINDRGTAVVLVEQSVNVALSLVDHAYFMEKGEVRFDGVAKDLLERPDLLRSVYLQGAAEGLA